MRFVKVANNSVTDTKEKMSIVYMFGIPNNHLGSPKDVQLTSLVSGLALNFSLAQLFPSL